MTKLRKKPIWIDELKVNDSISILKKAGIDALRDTNILSFSLKTAVITSAIWMIILFIISLLN